MARKRRSRRQPSENAWLLKTAGVGLALLVAVAAVAFLMLKPSSTELDERTGCPKGGPTAVTAVLVDLTDKVKPVTASEIRQRLADIISRVPKYGRIDIYSIESENDKLPAQIISVCSPGSAKDADPLYSSPELIAKWWRERYYEPLETVINKILSQTEGNTSPIMENIGSVSVLSFTADNSKSIQKRLIIVSDMLQHSDAFSLYRHGPDYEAYVASPKARGITADLREVQVDLFLIQRVVQGKALNDGPYIEFWLNWLSHQQSGPLHIVRLTGVN
jgi:hypothetical protein